MLRLILIASLVLGMQNANANETSVCFGTTDNGRLDNGWKLPASGENFEAYSLIGVSAGRNYVHSKVHQMLIESYKNLNTRLPEKRFMYGETGFENGGQFKPHKTHQNGLSVDFFVPVVDEKGKSVMLPTGPLNKLGYEIGFSKEGKYKDYTIDFEAMAEHLFELKKVSDKHGVKIWRVIFDNDLQKLLFATKKGKELKAQLQFSVKRPWVRHDEHYHVDFVVPCRLFSIN